MSKAFFLTTLRQHQEVFPTCVDVLRQIKLGAISTSESRYCGEHLFIILFLRHENVNISSQEYQIVCSLAISETQWLNLSCTIGELSCTEVTLLDVLLFGNLVTNLMQGTVSKLVKYIVLYFPTT